MGKGTEVIGTVKHPQIFHAFLKGHTHALACQAHSAHSAELIRYTLKDE